VELGPVPRTLIQAELEGPHVYEFAGGEAVLYSARSPDKDTVNEDAAALIPLGPQAGVLVVADGAGGTPAGQDASRTAVQSLIDQLQTVEDLSLVRTAILDAIEVANAAVQALGNGSMTTLAVAEVLGRTVRSYHVGDSPILVFGQRGRLKLQTVPHSPVGYALESGLLDEEDAVAHEDRHLVSNLLGASDMRIEIGPVLELARRDTLVISSDGLSDNFYLDEIVERTRKGPLLKQARRLADECRERMVHPEGDRPSHADDLTFALFRRGRGA
jgi:serine/threonine protein phosphatase PrpC